MTILDYVLYNNDRKKFITCVTLSAMLLLARTFFGVLVKGETFECKHRFSLRAECYSTSFRYLISIIIIFNFLSMILNTSPVKCSSFKPR